MDDLANLPLPAVLPAVLERTGALGFPMPSEPRTGAMLRLSKPGGLYVIDDMLPQENRRGTMRGTSLDSSPIWPRAPGFR
jgi:hypothetical protein